MTIRSLAIQVDASPIKCGPCKYDRGTKCCGLFNRYFLRKGRRLPECLAAEQARVPLPIGPPVQFDARGAFDEMEVEHPPVKLIPCSRCGDAIACMLVQCTRRCEGECRQLCRSCKLELMSMPARDQ